MKKRVLILLALLLCLCAAAGLADTPDLAGGDHVQVAHCSEYITLREEPSTKAAELARLPLGARARVIAGAGNGFVLVEYESQTGYVLAQYLEKVAAPDCATGDVVRVARCNEYITLREYPSTKAPELARLPLGALANMIGYDEDGFALVEYEGQAGYALGKYLEVAEGYRGEEVALSADGRLNVNLYLSRFSKLDFTWGSWCYDSASPRDADLIAFGIDYVWFNQHEYIESGEGGGEDNTRLAESHVIAAAQEHLGNAPEDMNASRFTYKDGYFYWQETGGHVPGGFACLDTAEHLGDGLYAVRFHVYGGGDPWEDGCCSLTPAEAAARYGYVNSEGFALIDVGEGSLEECDGWSLERWTLSR